MTFLVRDTPTAQFTNPLAARLREAREAKGLSRAQLSKLTEIPLKAIEKFEIDDQEPSASRLIKLCKVLGKTMEEILGLTPGTTSPALTLTAPGPTPGDELRVNEIEDPVTLRLNELDNLRLTRFRKATRASLAMIDDLRRELKYLEPDQLVDLAQARDANIAIGPSLADMLNAMTSGIENGQALCGEVEERIIDTAVLGADLFAVPVEKLKVAATIAAKAFKLETPFFGWGKPEEIVPLIREPMRRLALAGKAIELQA
jgi:transcriptional regulator with XRE-family HTH domain